MGALTNFINQRGAREITTAEAVEIRQPQRILPARPGGSPNGMSELGRHTTSILYPERPLTARLLRSSASAKDRSPSVDAPFQARENVEVVAARGRMLSSVRPLMRQDDSRRPVWEFADRVQITRSVLEA